jgi:hypothetical protein
MKADDVVVEAQNEGTEIDTENLSEDTGIGQQQLTPLLSLSEIKK